MLLVDDTMILFFPGHPFYQNIIQLKDFVRNTVKMVFWKVFKVIYGVITWGEISLIQNLKKGKPIAPPAGSDRSLRLPNGNFFRSANGRRRKTELVCF